MSYDIHIVLLCGYCDTPVYLFFYKPVPFAKKKTHWYAAAVISLWNLTWLTVISPPRKSPPRSYINRRVYSPRITYLECVPRCQAYSNLITELLLGGELVGSKSTSLWRDDRLPLTSAKKLLAND